MVHIYSKLFENPFTNKQSYGPNKVHLYDHDL